MRWADPTTIVLRLRFDKVTPDERAPSRSWPLSFWPPMH